MNSFGAFQHQIKAEMHATSLHMSQRS